MIAITATNALQMLGDSHDFTAETVTGTLHLNGHPPMTFKAGRAHYSDNSKIMLLSENVYVDASDTYHLQATSLHIDTVRKTAYTRQPVNVSAESGEITAAGIEILDEGQRILFQGNTTLILRSSQHVLPF